MNLIRYVKTNFTPFQELALNKLDVLAFVWTSYFNMASLVSKMPLRLGELKGDPYLGNLEKLHESFVPKTSSSLFRSMVISPRYRDAKILAYRKVSDEGKAIQFGAIAYEAAGHLIVVFEGTDLSYVGWKEDCIMSYSDTIGSYPLAERFLEEAMKLSSYPVIIAGHSKGGNVAAYLLTSAEDDSRIERVYSFEGPGFRNPNVFAAHPERVAKLEKYIPHSSVVGVLLNNEAETRIVKSRSVAVLQHNALKWVIHDNDFIYLSKRTISSRFIDKTANAWIAGLTSEERERFVQLFFGALNQTDTMGFGQLAMRIGKELPLLFKAFRSLSPGDKEFLRRVLRRFGDQALLEIKPKTGIKKEVVPSE